MKQSNAKKYIHDGILIYKSDTMHHVRSSVRGFLYKKSSDKLFKRSSHYKRYLIIDSDKPDTILIQENELPSKVPKFISTFDIICLQNVSQNIYDVQNLPWPYSFQLKTTTRVFTFFAPTNEE